jgi:hypothetical protein
MDLYFTIAAGSRQRSHSQVRLPRDSWPHFTAIKFETPPTWKARSPYLHPLGTGWAGYTPRHWVPFPSPPTSSNSLEQLVSFIIPRPWRKQRFQKFIYCCAWSRCRGNMFVYSRYLATGLHATCCRYTLRIDTMCNTRSSTGSKILLNIFLINFKELWMNIHIK